MKRLSLFLPLLLLGAFVCGPAMADTPYGSNGGRFEQNDADGRLTENIDSYVRRTLEEQRVPGYTLTVIKNGKILLKNQYGFANIRQRRPVTSQTVFGLASLTKTFTSLTLLSLVDKGLVRLDDPLERYLRGLSPEYRGLTIRQLASMTAGVPKTVPNEIRWPQQIGPLMRLPLQSAPGSQFLYSNFSYRLLGSVIESVTNQPYLQVVRETVLNPAQMNMTATTVQLESTGMVAQAYGDNNGQGPVREIDYKNPAISFAAGMLATTQDDLIKYVYALLERRFLSEAAYETMWYQRPPLTTGQPSNWAFGWSSTVRPIYGGRFITMNGGTPGVASSIILLPQSNSAVIALSNLRKPPVYAIAQSVARMAFAQEMSAQEGGAQGNGAPEMNVRQSESPEERYFEEYGEL